MSYDDSRLPQCPDCGKRLSTPHSVRCRACHLEHVKTHGRNPVIPGERIGKKLKVACSRCGGDAWVAVGNRKQSHYFCGDDCRKTWASERFNEQVSLTCRMCGKTFTKPQAWAKRHKHAYCSQPCYFEWQRIHPHRRNGKPTRPNVDLKCEQCGLMFKAAATRAERRYCSQSCQVAANMVIKTCPVCDTMFIVEALRKGQVHCTPECATAHQRPLEEQWRPCKRCGTLFYSKRPGHAHCSEECRRPPIILNCPTCKRDFRCVPAYFRQGRRFCSFRCYRRFTGETEPEANVRRCLETLGVQFHQEHAYRRYSLDFFIPALRIDLEVDGTYWHKRTKDRDARRDARLTAAGITVIRLADTGFYGPYSGAMLEHVRAALPDDLCRRVVPVPGPIDAATHFAAHRQLTLAGMTDPMWDRRVAE